MKMILPLFTALFLFVASCNERGDTEPGAVTDTISNDFDTLKSVSQIGGCYLMIQEKDTATLDLMVVDGKVSGKLQYRRFEKDDNDGMIDGILREGLIKANYTFQSEGTMSVREIVFLVRGDSLLEGYGEIRVEADTAKFVNATQMKFLPTPFVRVDCEKQ